MEVRTLLKRGADHPVNCEDDLFTFNDGTTYIGAVFDGCSTGIKSHFASALYGKIIKKYCVNNMPFYETMDIQLIGRSLYKHLYKELKALKIQLSLSPLEMLSTMILVVVEDNNAYVLVSGDGCIYIDGKEIKIESPGNAPNYLAYHLENELDGFLSLKEYNFKIEHTISVCSDGVYSFTDKNKEEATPRIIESLLFEENLIKSEAMLGRKYNLLLKEGYSNYDDLSIVRFIL